MSDFLLTASDRKSWQGSEGGKGEGGLPGFG